MNIFNAASEDTMRPSRTRKKGVGPPAPPRGLSRRERIIKARIARAAKVYNNCLELAVMAYALLLRLSLDLVLASLCLLPRAAELFGAEDVAATFVILLVGFGIPLVACLAHCLVPDVFGVWVQLFSSVFCRTRFRRGHTAHVRRRYYKRLLRHGEMQPSIFSYLPSACIELPVGEPDYLTRWLAPLQLVSDQFNQEARAAREQSWILWKLAYCHGHARLHKNIVVSDTVLFRQYSEPSQPRRLTRRLRRRLRRAMHGGSGPGNTSPSEPLDVSDDEDNDGVLDNLALRIPTGVANHFIPPRQLPVTEVLARFPPMSRDASPLYFEDTVPTLVEEEPNTLVESPNGEDFNSTIARLHLDLVWASRHAVALRQQLAEASRRNLRSLRVSPTHRLPLWVVPLLDQIRPVQELLRRWDEGRAWIQRGGISTSELQRIELVRELFNVIPWSSRVPTGNPAVHLSTLELASFLSNRWLNDEMLNAGQDWIVRRIAAAAAAQGEQLTTTLTNVYFLPSLRNARALHSDYHIRVNSALDNGILTEQLTSFFVPANPGGNHWAAFHVDPVNSTYTYIDSLGRAPNPDDLALLNWYLRAFNRRWLHPAQQPSVVAPMQEDGHSCGIIYLDTVASAHAGTDAWSPERAREARMDWFIRLAAPFQQAGPVDGDDSSPEDSGSSSSDSDDDSNEGWDFLNGLEDVPLVYDDHAEHSDTDDHATEPAASSEPSSEPNSRSPSPNFPTSLFGYTASNPASRTARSQATTIRPSAPTRDIPQKRASDDLDSSSSDSESGEESRRASKARRGPSGTSKSWVHAKSVNVDVSSGDLREEDSRLRVFREKIRSDDKRAEFKDGDIRMVRCSACGEWVRMRVGYDVSRWKEHRRTDKCTSHQSTRLSSISLTSFFKPKKPEPASAPAAASRPRLPCPGLRRDRDQRIDRYLYRSAASGGGAPSRNRLAVELFGHILSVDECAWSRLSPQRQRMVLRREESQFRWRNSRASNAVFASDCDGHSRSPPSTPEDEALPCAECDDLYRLHTFRSALLRPIPDEAKMKHTPQIYRSAELGDIYARVRGVKKLMEADGGKGFMRRFAQGYLDGDYDKADVVIGMIETLVVKNDRARRGKSMVGMRYPEALDAFVQMLFSISPHAYRTFRAHFGGRSESSIRSLRAKMPRFEPGFSNVNIERIAAYLDQLGYHGPLAFGWDDTELQEGVTVMQRTPEFCIVVGTADGPLEVRNKGDIDSILRSLNPETKLATKLRAWLIAIPMLRIPPILVALVARGGEEGAEELFVMHKRLTGLLHAHGLHPTSCASDGTETERKLQHLIWESAPEYFEFEIVMPLANCTIRFRVAIINGVPVIFVQDSKHGLKTARNQLLTGARLLVIGAFCVYYAMVSAAAHHPSSPLYIRDVERVDKQDDRAAARLFSGEALDCVLLQFPENRAFAVYLFVMGELVDAWQNRALPHAERVRMALRARYFLMAWHAHISAHPDHRHDVNFISRESYDIFLRLCDGLIELIVVYREFYPTYALLPWLHSTEMLEHFFGIMRSLKSDFNFADALWLEPKLRTLMMGAFKNLSPEEQANATAAGYWHTYFSAPDFNEAMLRTYPDNTGVKASAERGLRDATMLLDFLGIDASEMLRVYKPPTYDDGSTTSELPAMKTLHDLLTVSPLAAPASVAQEDALQMAQYALVAENTEATLNIMDLPDSTVAQMDQLRAAISEALGSAETPEMTPDPVFKLQHDLGLTPQTSLNRENLVNLRKGHQTRLTSRAVRQAARAGGITLAAVVDGQLSRARKQPTAVDGTPREPPAESLRDQLVRNLRTTGISVQAGTGSTSGVGRVIRHTGTFTAEPNNSARTAQKAVSQKVHAQDFMTLRAPLFLPFQFPGMGEVHNADITPEMPLAPKDLVSFARPGRQDEPASMLLGQVITMYTNSGAKNASHDHIPTITSVGTPSYVYVQVFVWTYGNVFSSIACPQLHTSTFMRVPRTHLIMSLARDRSLNSEKVIIPGSRPLVHITLGAWSFGVERYLRTREDDIVCAVRALLKKQRDAKSSS
ncbi:hypothetical protein PENSPDRAFT_685015 [Peniophora sp. CONT]|nr:hypothetical protein PENSPDRAFT_685015 [Peniophora sp. CONT]